MVRNDTADSFPTYADLTHTLNWSRSAGSPIVGAHDPTPIVEDPELRRYAHGELLGTGGMGTVMLARDARIGRDVAIKQLHTDRELAPEDRERFMREARVQGQLEHPSIVPVYDIDERSDGATFFTMRRVLGRTLHAILEDLRRGSSRYTQRELLTAFATVCLTVHYAHSRGVVHRDLKPANIMLGDFGEVYVLDWGLALVLGETVPAPVDEPVKRLSKTGGLFGTPLYMAPEQMADPSVGPAADVFSLGALLFEILTFERLRDAETMFLPAEARPSVRAPMRNIAPELETICVRATQSDPAERYGSARALQEAVASYLDGDRDTQTRRELAAAHARAATEALARADKPGADYERERGIATNELLKTLALDPTNDEHVAALAHFLASPPRVLPAAVVAEVTAGEQKFVKLGARLVVLAMLLWIACIPFVFAMGVRDMPTFIVGCVWIGIAALLAFHTSRRAHVPLWLQTAMILALFFAAAIVGRMFGPLVMVPMVLATTVIALQTHPHRGARNLALLLGTIAMVLPVLLEAAGILEMSYVADADRIAIVPHVIELHPTATILFVLGATVGMMIVPCVFIRRLRVTLSEAQMQLMLQAWHLEQLTVPVRPRDPTSP